MVLTALRGALGFCSRLPVGRDEAAWAAFRRTPAAFPLAGYVVGALVALPLLVGLPGPTLALTLVAWLLVVAGVNHADGLADLGDAAAVHGDPVERRAVMCDTAVGVGAALALGVSLLGVALAGLALADLPRPPAVALVVAAEVAAKLAVAALVCVGDPSHEGFGSAFATRSSPRDLVGSVAAATPLVLLGGWGPLVSDGTVPEPVAAVGAWAPVGLAALGAAVLVAVVVGGWARRNLGGVGGDVFGATNELARVAALHAGVVAWTLW